MDKMYKESSQPYMRELYGDSMHTPIEKTFPVDSGMYNASPISEPLKAASKTNDSMFNDLVHQLFGGYIAGFNEISKTEKFKNYVTLDYMSFNIAYESRPINSHYLPNIPNLKTILVENNYMMGLYSPGIVTKAFLFIPFELLGLKRRDDYKMMDKIYIYNNSNPMVQTVTNGVFRTPVSISKDVNIPGFDKKNTEIYDDDWFMIKLSIPGSHFCKK